MQITAMQSPLSFASTEDIRLAQRNLTESIVLSLTFLSILLLFGFQSSKNCVEIRSGEAPMEKRNLASFESPDFSSVKRLSLFPTVFEHFFNDRFAFRLSLISSRAYLRYRAFALGTQTVTVGRNGWLFYSEGQAMDYLKNDKPLTPSVLKYWGVHYLEKRNSWCAARGIKYLFYSPPLASTIYPEMLNGSVKRTRGPTRLDQLFAFLNQRGFTNFVDLRPSLVQTRNLPIFLKTDTHWNEVGGFVATGEVLKKLKTWFPNITLLSGSELQVEPMNFSGDLAGLAGGGNSIFEKTYRQKKNSVYRWRFVSPCHDSEGGPEYRTPFATEVNDARLPTAVCIRDSFTIAQRIYLSNHFRRIVYGWWDEFPYDVIEKEQPDVVLQEKCERMIGF